jgi:hypothetical protein
LKSDALKMDALKNERHAEPAENEIMPAASGSSFIQTFRTWREKRMRLAELRKDVTQMNDLRRQERLKEKEADVRAATVRKISRVRAADETVVVSLLQLKNKAARYRATTILPKKTGWHIASPQVFCVPSRSR